MRPDLPGRGFRQGQAHEDPDLNDAQRAVCATDGLSAVAVGHPEQAATLVGGSERAVACAPALRSQVLRATSGREPGSPSRPHVDTRSDERPDQACSRAGWADRSRAQGMPARAASASRPARGGPPLNCRWKRSSLENRVTFTTF
jgi:hypothetical protein